MDNLEIIQYAVNFIEANLYENINPSILCVDLDISEYHFHQLFKNVIGHTCVEYVTNRRISDQLYRWAASHKKWSVGDLAFWSKLPSLNAFNKRLKKDFNTSPKQYYKNFNGSEVFPPFNFLNYTSVRCDYEFKPIIREFDSTVLVGKSVSTQSYKKQHIKDIQSLKRDTFNMIKHDSILSTNEVSLIYNASIDCKTRDNLEFEYFDGYTIDNTQNTPDNFRLLNLPKQKYICFKTINTKSSIDKMIHYIYSDYLIHNKISLLNSSINVIERFDNEYNENNIELCFPIK